MQAKLSLIAAALWAGLVSAESQPSADQYCLISCYTAFTSQTFAGEPDALTDYYGDLCAKEIHVASVLACSKLYCTDEETKAGYGYYEDICTEYYLAPPLPLSIIDNYTSADIEALPRISVGAIDVLNTTTIPDKELFDLASHTISDWYGVREKHLWYSKAQYIFWGIILAAGILNNVFTRLFSGRSNKLWQKVRGHLIVSPTFKQRCAEPVAMMYTIPPRLESIIIFAMIAINVVLSSVGYPAFEGNLYFGNVPAQTWRYLADRTGYLSYANLSIFWLFGIRNNILLWATGWEYPTFNRFHRWVAGVSTLQAVVHSVAYTAQVFTDVGGKAVYIEYWSEEWWYTGVVATIAMSFIIGFSFLVIRVRFYDFFLVAHIVLALIVLVNLFYHTKIFLGEYDGFLWPCVAFWSFDRAMRLGRVLLNLATATSSKVSMHNDSGLIRIDLTRALGALNRVPGSNVYIYFPRQLRFWESHPFTLVHWKSHLPSSGSASPTTPTSDPEKTAVHFSSSEALPEDNYTLMVRPHRGFTSRLARKLTSPASHTVLVEGPYGHAPQLKGFDSVLYIIGGSGISVAVSSIYSALAQPTRPRIRMVWAMRSAAMLHSVANRELKAAIAAGGVEIDAYVTRQAMGEVEEEIDGGVEQRVDGVQIRRAGERPDITRLVGEAAVAHREGGTRLAVVACGPAGMMDGARRAAAEEMRRGGEVQFFLESFEW